MRLKLRAVLAVLLLATVATATQHGHRQPVKLAASGLSANRHFQPRASRSDSLARLRDLEESATTTSTSTSTTSTTAPRPKPRPRPAPKANPAPRPTAPPAAPRPPVSPGSNRALGQQMAADGYHWTGSQWNCLDELWGVHESGWNTYAGHPAAAYGIPQSYPGNKMASVGADWQTNPRTQITWGLSYIAGRYGTPCHALSVWFANSPHGY